MIQINETLFSQMLEKAANHPRKRDWFDLRNSSEDNSQRMLVATLPSQSPERIDNHPTTSESFILLKGKMDIIIYEKDETDNFQETKRMPLDPLQGACGIQIPANTWHSVLVHEPSVFFESKDGKYVAK